MKMVYYYPARFPVTMYGGTPRVIQWLIPEMLKLGHQVYLMALPGSTFPGVEIIPVPEGSRPEQIVGRVPADADLVHLFSYKTYMDFKKPLLITFDRLGYIPNLHPNTVFVGKKHAALHHSKYYVYHGLAPQEYPVREQKEDFLVFIAQVNSFSKNLEGAIRVARDAGTRLVIAGGYRFSLRRNLESVGIIGETRKRDLLQRAKALIFPVLWDEAFGLVMIEALACGTPVIGTSRGEIPEVVKPGSGFVCNSHREMVEAVKNLGSIRAADCRRRVEEFFNARRMAAEYEGYYRKILERGYFDPDHHPWLEPGLNLAEIFHLYEDFRPPSWFRIRFGPRINSLYTRYRERFRVYAPDEIPTRDLTNY